MGVVEVMTMDQSREKDRKYDQNSGKCESDRGSEAKTDDF